MNTDSPAPDDIPVEGGTLRVALAGEEGRPALVLAHMLGTDLTMWDRLVPAFAEHFRVVRLDARGHGGSASAAGPVTLERLGRDVLAVLDALGLARAHFCGLSMGGATGLWLLAHAPERIERAVIVDGAAKLGDPSAWNARIAAALADGMEQTLEPTMERWFSPRFARDNPDEVEGVRALLRATPPRGYAACCAALRDMDLREAVRGVPHPVLVVRGAEDGSVTAADAAFLAAAMADAQVVELDARHCAPIEARDAFLSAVLGFLTAAPASGRLAKGKTARGKAAGVKGAARRAAGRGIAAARRPVARTAPVSGKAVAKASASRKTAARKNAARSMPRPAEPVAARRRGATAAPSPRTAGAASKAKAAPASSATEAAPVTAAPRKTSTRAGGRNGGAAPAKPAPAKPLPAKAASGEAAAVKPAAPAKSAGTARPRKPAGGAKKSGPSAPKSTGGGPGAGGRGRS